MVASTEKKIAWQLIGKEAGNWPNIVVFENYRDKQQE